MDEDTRARVEVCDVLDKMVERDDGLIVIQMRTRFDG